MDEDGPLANFRQEWRKELWRGASTQEQNSQSASGPNGQTSFEREEHKRSPESNDSATLQEVKAGELFKHGVLLEQNGKLYEAIRFYRKAIALVPDIEIIVHRQNIQERMEVAEDNASSDGDYNSDDGDERELGMNDLVSRFESLMGNNQPICQPTYSQEDAHISCLPVEMLERILLWVVGQDLDLISLDRMASVCRGFYLICRKPDIWKRACFRVWGINVGNAEEYGSWREMYLTRPRPRFNGCYISKTTYFRSGENSFQDETYQPWHFVVYYRYLRFFPNGQVMMLTTADEPKSTVNLLKKDSNSNQIFQGHYRIHGSSITLLFRTLNRKERHRGRNRRITHGTTDVAETVSQMELEVKSIRGRPNWQLTWNCYSIVSCYFTGSRTTSILDVSDSNKFSPMNYSRVKSYTLEANFPLA